MKSENLKKNSSLIIFAVAILAVGGLLFLQKRSSNDSYFGDSSYVDYSQSQSGETLSNDTIVESDLSGTNEYQDSKLNFRVNLPQSAQATFLDEGDIRTILLKGGGYDMQIYVTPFDENIVVTPERIKQDIPDMKIESPEYVMVGGQTKALAFISTNEQGQKFREIWFVKDFHLYQILSQANSDSVTGRIMQSWKWAL